MMCVHLVNGVLLRAAPDGVSLEDYRETVLSLDTLFLSLQFVDRTSIPFTQDRYLFF